MHVDEVYAMSFLVFRFKVKGEHFAVLHVVNNLSDKKNKKVISRR